MSEQPLVAGLSCDHLGFVSWNPRTNNRGRAFVDRLEAGHAGGYGTEHGHAAVHVDVPRCPHCGRIPGDYPGGYCCPEAHAERYQAKLTSAVGTGIR